MHVLIQADFDVSLRCHNLSTGRSISTRIGNSIPKRTKEWKTREMSKSIQYTHGRLSKPTLYEYIIIPPYAGGSRNLSTRRKSSTVVASGDKPPCTHKNCSLTIAANGRQSNDSITKSYISSEYLYSHSVLNVKYSVRCRHSWLPRSKKSVSGYVDWFFKS